MQTGNLSPISVEIVARCGKKIRLDLKLVIPVAALALIISAVVDWFA